MFSISKNGCPHKSIALNTKTFDTYSIVENDYQKYLDGVDKIISQESPNNRDTIKEYITDKNVPKNCKMKGKINDMIDVLDDILKRTIIDPNKNFFKFPFYDDDNRDAITIHGIAGSGKSYWISDYCKLYKELYPKNDIYLITCNIRDDKLFKGLKIKKLVVDSREKIDNLNFDESSFSNSCVIFDDIESSEPSISLWIKLLRDMLFEKSRKHGTVILSAIHKSLGGNTTVKSNLECTGAVVFPRANPRETKNLLQNYFELNKSQIKKIMDEKQYNRSVYVHKVYPRYYIGNSKIQMID